MADDIVDRLELACTCGPLDPDDSCTPCRARTEIERLREQAEYLHDNVAMLRNEVAEWEFEARQWQEKAEEARHLRAVLDAIDAQHQPYIRTPVCEECEQMWPCGTHLLIHPKEADGE